MALAGAGSAAARTDVARARLDSPQLGEIARGPALIADAKVAATPSRSAYWGGATTASTGETVTIYVSDAYPQDPATAQLAGRTPAPSTRAMSCLTSRNRA